MPLATTPRRYEPSSPESRQYAREIGESAAELVACTLGATALRTWTPDRTFLESFYGRPATSGELDVFEASAHKRANAIADEATCPK